MVYFSPLAAEIGCRVWGTPENFSRFRVLASFLHRHHLTDINQTLQCLTVSCAGALYTHFRGLLPLTEFC